MTGLENSPMNSDSPCPPAAGFRAVPDSQPRPGGPAVQQGERAGPAVPEAEQGEKALRSSSETAWYNFLLFPVWTERPFMKGLMRVYFMGLVLSLFNAPVQKKLFG